MNLCDTLESSLGWPELRQLPPLANRCVEQIALWLDSDLLATDVDISFKCFRLVSWTYLYYP